MQFFRISASFGQWYATGFSFDTNKVQVFRCDKITALEESTLYSPRPVKELTSLPADAFRHEGEENFIANYFLGYTDNIISVKPKKLKKLLQDRISALESHYSFIQP
ncbi:MAG TPA: hypothetical protein PLW98_00405 [Bacillota bacterium]|nr:hypothetical protein [Bacillota bacterium]HPW39955.1 hypothetical protein [Bacillota bacterium]